MGVSDGRWRIRAACCASSLLISLGALGSAAQTTPGEWAQWRGPQRTGISRETGLLKSWPAGGPRLLWRAQGLGGGYSTPSVAAGRIFGMGYRGNDEVVWALDTRSGRELWSTPPIAPANRTVGYPDGSRCTPTVDGDRVYALGVSGDLVCLSAATGKELWRKNLVRDFGGAIPNWGYAESPLVDGSRVIVAPGGRTATIVALDKMTGQVIWRSAIPGGDPAGYSSAIAADVGGLRQYIHYLSGGVVGVAAQDGRFLWRYGKPGYGIVISTPIYHDGHVFATTAYSVGGGLARLTGTPGGTTAAEVYFDPEMQNHHGGAVLVNGFLYYSEGHNVARLACRDFKTGRLAWVENGKHKCSLTYADGHLYARSERGTMLLLEASPRGMVVKGSFEQPGRSGKAAWPHPVVAGGRLYLRDQDLLLCYDVKGDAP